MVGAFNDDEMNDRLKVIGKEFSVCKVADCSQIDLDAEFVFIGKTDEEMSVVCETSLAPSNAIEREDGWRCFRIEGTLDFSLVGILAKVSALLAEAGIGIFAISTYNTDYILTKAENIIRALQVLEANGYTIQ